MDYLEKIAEDAFNDEMDKIAWGEKDYTGTHTDSISYTPNNLKVWRDGDKKPQEYSAGSKSSISINNLIDKNNKKLYDTGATSRKVTPSSVTSTYPKGSENDNRTKTEKFWRETPSKTVRVNKYEDLKGVSKTIDTK